MTPVDLILNEFRLCLDAANFLFFAHGSMEAAMITEHTDVVGSLLRPVPLRKARDDWMAGGVVAPESP